MTRLDPRVAPNGKAYLNAGCGETFSEDWNNLDIMARPGVVRHDLRRPLPYFDGAFDAAYASHVVEHMNPRAGARFLGEMRRVLKPGGVCRIVVPDYEKACREYLARLGEAARDPSPEAMRRYRWSVFELVDQFVREECGGAMLEALRAGDVDEDYVRARGGDEFMDLLGRRGEEAPARRGSAVRTRWREIRHRLKKAVGLRKGPAESGELHRWAYDRLSLRFLMEAVGFADVAERKFGESAIPDWERYRLDTSAAVEAPRKPDSLYMEGTNAVSLERGRDEGRTPAPAVSGG